MHTYRFTHMHTHGQKYMHWRHEKITHESLFILVWQHIFANTMTWCKPQIHKKTKLTFLVTSSDFRCFPEEKWGQTGLRNSARHCSAHFKKKKKKKKIIRPANTSLNTNSAPIYFLCFEKIRKKGFRKRWVLTSLPQNFWNHMSNTTNRCNGWPHSMSTNLVLPSPNASWCLPK